MLKKILHVLLNILLFLLLITFSYLTLIRGVFAKSIEDVKISDIESLLDYSKNDFHQLLDKTLNEYEIPVAVLDEVIDSGSHKEIINDYLNNYVNAVKKGSAIPSIPTDKINQIMIKSVENYNQKTNSSVKIDKITNMTNSISKKIENKLEPITKNSALNKTIQFLYNDSVYYSFLVIICIIILLIALIAKKEALISLGIISMINGFLILGSYFLLKFDAIKNIMDFIIRDSDTLLQNVIVVGGIFLITGIILLLLYQFIQKKTNTNKD